MKTAAVVLWISFLCLKFVFIEYLDIFEARKYTRFLHKPESCATLHRGLKIAHSVLALFQNTHIRRAHSLPLHSTRVPPPGLTFARIFWLTQAALFPLAGVGWLTGVRGAWAASGGPAPGLCTWMSPLRTSEHQRERGEERGKREERSWEQTGLIREGRGKVWNNTEGEREKKRWWKKKEEVGNEYILCGICMCFCMRMWVRVCYVRTDRH